MNFKKDFPIFKNNPNLVYFDSTASSQKPKKVIDDMAFYLSNNYSNIHRGMYDIAIESEKLYNDSKRLVAETIGRRDYKEIIYTANSTYAANLLAQSFKKSGYLQNGDTVLISIVEHHANIVPWLILKEEIGINLVFVDIDENYNLDMKDFKEKYNSTVKVISLTHVSNVTGQVFDLKKVGDLKRDDTFFVVDASQSVPHMKVDVQELNCDFLFFTGHKVLADSGIGILWGRKTLLSGLKPAFSGGGAISEVTCDKYLDAAVPDKFEPGTPNMTGAVSLLSALQYIDSIGGFEVIEDVEIQLMKYFLEKLSHYPFIEIIGSKNIEKRVGVFSLVFLDIHSHDVAEIFADYGVAVRSGKHCAHPLYTKVGKGNSVRVSFYIYNDRADIDKFFEVVDIIKKQFSL